MTAPSYDTDLVGIHAHGAIHVYPRLDIYDHDITTSDCLCGPRLELNPGSSPIIIHHMLAGERTA